MKNIYLFLILVAFTGVASRVALADTTHIYELTYHNGTFSPQKIEVPAGKKFRLKITNEDDRPMEFESSDLNREHVITTGATWHAFIGPLDAGNYSYFNDFDRAAKGEILAR